MGVLFEWHFWTFLGTSLFRKKCYSTKRGRKCDSPPPFFGVEITPSFDGCTFGTFWNFCFPGKVSSSVSLYLSMTTGAQFRTRPFISLLFPRRSHFGQLSPPHPCIIRKRGRRKWKILFFLLLSMRDEGVPLSYFVVALADSSENFFLPFPSSPFPPRGVRLRQGIRNAQIPTKNLRNFFKRGFLCRDVKI